jgi:putative transposase
MRRKRKPLKKLPETVSKLVEAAQKPFKLFFHDEARFGRISQAIACWSPIGTRPMIPKQVIREYTYAYTAACPENGETVSLILPQMTTHCMNIFLEELGSRYSDNQIGLVTDGASNHDSKDLKIPDNITLIPLPPYSPELNPVENFWKEFKQEGFYNRVFQSLKAVEDLLEEKLKYFMDNPQLVQSIVGYHWILSALK